MRLALLMVAISGCSGVGSGGTNPVASTPTSTPSYAIGGSVAGLTSGTSLVLQDNGGNNLTVSANGAFTFSTALATGAAYSVSVLTQPAGQSCTIANASGTVGSAPVTNVLVTCTSAVASGISGAISPAPNGAGTILTLSGAASASTTADGSGNYSFTGLAAGVYTVTPNAPATTFSPPNLQVTLSGAGGAIANFTASSNVIFFDDFQGSSLGPAWTVISRHGEYAQGESECNIPQQVSVGSGLLTITAAVGPYTCGDFNTDGSVRHAPASWPYITGDIQWTSLNFTYGTVTARAKFPPKATGLWPAIWLLGANCQNTNPYTADIGYSTCPNFGPTYLEVDNVECDLNNWCQLAMWTGGNFPTCGFKIDPLDAGWHLFSLTWTANSVTETIDGVDSGCSYTTSGTVSIPSGPMFLIIQIQTGGAGGTPNDALLPATLQLDYVKVTQP